MTRNLLQHEYKTPAHHQNCQNSRACNDLWCRDVNNEIYIETTYLICIYRNDSDSSNIRLVKQTDFTPFKPQESEQNPKANFFPLLNPSHVYQCFRTTQPTSFPPRFITHLEISPLQVVADMSHHFLCPHFPHLLASFNSCLCSNFLPADRPTCLLHAGLPTDPKHAGLFPPGFWGCCYFDKSLAMSCFFFVDWLWVSRIII